MRSQLAPANTARPAIAAVVSANLDRNSTTVAPGGLVTIFGTNLAKTTTDLSGWEGTRLPDILNGVAVAVGGQRARLLYVSPAQINAVLPSETPVGRQPAAVNNGNGPAEAPVTVAAVAPAVFFGPSGGIVVKNSDFSLVGRRLTRRARAMCSSFTRRAWVRLRRRSRAPASLRHSRRGRHGAGRRHRRRPRCGGHFDRWLRPASRGSTRWRCGCLREWRRATQRWYSAAGRPFPTASASPCSNLATFP